MFKSFDLDQRFDELLSKKYNELTLHDDLFKSWINGLDSVSIKSMSAGQALEQYNGHLQNLSKQTSLFTKVSTTAGNVAKSFGASLLNMGAGVLAGMAIQGLVTWIYDMVTATEQAIQKGEEAQKSIQDTFDEFQAGKNSLTSLAKTYSKSTDAIDNQKEAISTLAETYTELRKGVNDAGENISLNDSDYQAYLDISNQLADAYPRLVSGYDEQGNAILNLGTNADEAAQSLMDLYDAQQLTANMEIRENLQNVYDGVIAQVKSQQKELKTLQSEQDKVNKAADLWNSTDSLDNLSQQVSTKRAIELDVEELGADLATEYHNQILGILQDLNIGFDETSFGEFYDEDTGLWSTKTYSFSALQGTEEQLAQLQERISGLKNSALDSLTAESNDIAKEIDGIKLTIENAWDDLSTTLSQDLQTESSFTNLNSDIQDAFLNNLSNLDLSKLLDASEYDGDIEKFLNTEFLAPMESMSQESQDILSNALNLDISSSTIEDFKSQINEALQKVFPDDAELQSAFRQALGFDETIEDVASGMNKLVEQIAPTDTFKSESERLSTYLDRLRTFQLESSDLKNALSSQGMQEGESSINAVLSVMEQVGFISDRSAESIQKVCDALVEAGVLTDNLSSASGNVIDNFESVKTASSDLVESIATIKEALANQTAGTSIDAESFSSDALADYTSALEHNNGTLQLNAAKVKELTKAKVEEQIATNNATKAQKQSEYRNNAKEIDTLRQHLEELDASSTEYQDTLAQIQQYQSDNTAIYNQCQQLDLLNAKLRESVGEYQAWIDAQNAPESGDMFDDAKNMWAQIREVSNTESENYGKVGNETYQAAVDFIVPDSIDKTNMEAVDDYLDSINKYLNFDDNKNVTGVDLAQFMQDSADKGLMYLDEVSGEYKIAGEKTMQDFAEGLNLSLPFVQAIFGELEEYLPKGKELEWGDAGESLADMQLAAGEAANSLRTLEENGDLDIRLDVSGLQSTDEQLAALDKTIQEMNTVKARPDVDTSQIEHANTVIEYCVAMQQALNNPVVMHVDTSSLANTDISDAITALQELQQAENRKEVNLAVGADTSQAEADIQTALDTIKSQPENMLKVGIQVDENTTADSILAQLKGQTAQQYLDIGAKIGSPIDDSAVTGYQADDKNATVIYDVNHTAVDMYNPLNLYRTVTYTIKTEGTVPGASGTGNLNGTAHAYGTAFADGSWGAKEGGIKLVGELGREIVVDPANGSWHTVGDNGAEFTYIPKNAIVFNHLQSEALLKRGFVNSRGTAFASGSALASGTPTVSGGGWSVQVVQNVGSSSKDTANAAPTTTVSVSPNSSSAKDSEEETESALDKLLDKLGRLFDWIEVRIDRLQSKIDLNLAKSENATTYQGKNKYVNRAANNTSTLLSVEEKALKRYSRQADSIAQQVGLSSTLKKRVQNGTIDIEELSEDDQKRVDIYKEWYDKVVDTRQAIQDLKQQQKELAQTKLDNIVEQYETITGLAEAAQNTSAAIVDYNTSAGKAVDNSSTKKQIQNQMAQQQKITNKLRNERSAYVKELQKAKKVFGENSNEYREAKEQLENLKESIYESRTAYNELNDQLRELDLTKIQYVVDIFTNAADRIKSALDLKSARGETVTESDYTNQMSTNNQLINQLYGQRQEYLEDLLSNDKFSEKWKEAYDNINTIDQTVMGLLQDNEALKDSIWEVRWKPFIDLQERRDNQISDNDFMLGQISDEMTLDDKGNLTSAGEDVLAITRENIDLTNQKIADYREALDKLGEDLANGNISQDEYNEKSREYIEVIQDAVSANKDYNDSIVEIYKNQITKQNEALQDYIDIRQEANQKDQEAYEYQKKLKSQYKDVSALRAQILALEGTTNLQGQAELERLKAELSEQEDSLDDTIRDHRYDMIDQGYDQLSQNAQDNLDKTLEELESNAARQREVVNMMLSDVKKSYEDAYAEIRKIIESTNITVTTPNVTVTNTVTDPIDTSVGGDTTKAEQAASGNPVSSGTGTPSGSQTGTASSNSGATTSLPLTTEDEKRRKEEEMKLKEEADKAERQRLLNIAKDIIASIKKKSLTDKQVSAHSSLFQYVYRKSGRPLYDDDAYFLGKSIGVSMPKSADKLNATYKRNILTKLKEIGYAQGTKDYQGDGLAWMDEAGAGSEMIIRKSDNAILTRLQPHDQIVPEAMTRNLWSWASIDPATLTQANAFVPENATSAEPTQINLGGMNITMNGRVYKDDIDWYRQMPESVVREMGKRLDTYFARDFEKTGRGRRR